MYATTKPQNLVRNICDTVSSIITANSRSSSGFSKPYALQYLSMRKRKLTETKILLMWVVLICVYLCVRVKDAWSEQPSFLAFHDIKLKFLKPFSSSRISANLRHNTAIFAETEDHDNLSFHYHHISFTVLSVLLSLSSLVLQNLSLSHSYYLFVSFFFSLSLSLEY